MVDEAYTGHVDLVPGMTRELLEQGWVDHTDDESGS
jgi:hypothetical protein